MKKITLLFAMLTMIVSGAWADDTELSLSPTTAQTEWTTSYTLAAGENTPSITLKCVDSNNNMEWSASGVFDLRTGSGRTSQRYEIGVATTGWVITGYSFNFNLPTGSTNTEKVIAGGTTTTATEEAQTVSVTGLTTTTAAFVRTGNNNQTGISNFKVTVRSETGTVYTVKVVGDETSLATGGVTVNGASYGNGTGLVADAAPSFTVNAVSGYVARGTISDQTINVVYKKTPTFSTDDAITYYTLKNRNRWHYASYASDDANLSTNVKSDAEGFYFTQSETQASASTSTYQVISIHNYKAGSEKEMTSINSWGETETNWYLTVNGNSANDFKISNSSDFKKCLNDYGSNVQLWDDDNDNGNGWLIEDAITYTVQVDGTSDSNAGFTYGATLYNGDKFITSLTDASQVTPNDVSGYSANAFISATTFKVEYTKSLVPTTISDGKFAEDTKWYSILNKNVGHYVGTSEGFVSTTKGTVTQSGEEIEYYPLLLNNTTVPVNDEGALWAVTYDETKGYQFYNKAKGTTYVLANADDGSSKDESAAYMTDATTNTYSYYGVKASKVAGYWNVYEKNATDNYWNYRSPNLSTWNWGAGWNEAEDASGSQFAINEVTIYNITVTPNGAGDVKAIINGTEYANGSTYFIVSNAAPTVTATVATGYIYTVNIDKSAKTITVTYNNAIPFDASKTYALRSASGSYLVLDTDDNNGNSGAEATAAHYGKTPTLFTIVQNGNAYSFQDASNKSHYIGLATSVWWNVSNVTESVWDITVSDDCYLISRTDRTDGMIHLGNKDNTNAGTGIYNNQWESIKWYIDEMPITETRTTAANTYGTICLPYDATVEGAVVMAFTGRSANGLVFTPVDGNAIQAGVPYLYRATANEQTFTTTGTTYTEATTVDNFTGSYTEVDLSKTASNTTENYFLYTQDNKFHPAGTYVHMGAYRCYFPTLPSVSEARVSSNSVVFGIYGDATTGISTLNTSVDLNKDGKFIQNGRMVIVNNGKKFNAAGQIVK